jgi:hypothetical protein
MAKTWVFLALALQAFIMAPVHAGEADEASMQILLDTLQANKQALVDVNLDLTDEEAVAFWPVYERYQGELEALQARLLEVIEAYGASFGKTTDEQANVLIDDYLTVELDRAALRRKYLEPMTEALPGRKVMRFYQIENKIDAVVRYDLAASIPVVER